MTRTHFSAFALAALLSPSIAAGNPYENAAKLDMEHLASSILAASVCAGVRFNGDTVVTSLAAAVVLLGRKRTEDAFFSAMRANIDGMSDTGKEAWCATQKVSIYQFILAYFVIQFTPLPARTGTPATATIVALVAD
jgi:hypothetical protein